MESAGQSKSPWKKAQTAQNCTIFLQTQCTVDLFSVTIHPVAKRLSGQRVQERVYILRRIIEMRGNPQAVAARGDDDVLPLEMRVE